MLRINLRVLICFSLFLSGISVLGFSQNENLHPSFNLNTSQLKVLISDQPQDIQQKILSNPNDFLNDYRPLLSLPWQNLVLVDKKHELPQDYAAKDLVLLKKYPLTLSRQDLKVSKSIMNAILAMDKAVKKEHMKLVYSSAYRSWEYQKALFQRYVDQDGIATADRYSSRPGRSQHQLGTVIDFGSVTPEFENTKEGQWLFLHSEEYGFSLSFPKGFEELTGYMYEPWHYRYIGIEACKVQKKWFNDIQQRLLEFNFTHGEAIKASLIK